MSLQQKSGVDLLFQRPWSLVRSVSPSSLPLIAPRVNVWSQNELLAMEAERTTLGSLGLFDSLACQFPKQEAPAYT